MPEVRRLSRQRPRRCPLGRTPRDGRRFPRGARPRAHLGPAHPHAVCSTLAGARRRRNPLGPPGRVGARPSRDVARARTRARVREALGVRRQAGVGEGVALHDPSRRRGQRLEHLGAALQSVRLAPSGRAPPPHGHGRLAVRGRRRHACRDQHDGTSPRRRRVARRLRFVALDGARRLRGAPSENPSECGRLVPARRHQAAPAPGQPRRGTPLSRQQR